MQSSLCLPAGEHQHRNVVTTLAATCPWPCAAQPRGRRQRYQPWCRYVTGARLQHTAQSAALCCSPCILQHGHVCSTLPTWMHCHAVHEANCIVGYRPTPARAPACHVSAAQPPTSWPHATARLLAQQARHGQLARRPFIRHRTHDSSASGAGGCGRGRGRGRGRLLLGSLRPRALRVPARLEAHRCVLRTMSGSYSSSVSGSPLCSQAMQPARMLGHLNAYGELCLSGRGAHAAWLLARRRATRDTGSWL